jgi:nicotinamidase/pyrazinamidase
MTAVTGLLIVDVQHDFLPGGALGVPRGDEVVAPLVELAGEVDVVVASRDWHPPEHCSFRARGGPWPPHCVAGTEGAELHPAIAELAVDHVADKGTDPDQEAYSAFAAPGLADELRRRGVTRLLVGGLATDYCVRASALDALAAGFEVAVVEEAVRAVEVAPGDGERALGEIRRAGGRVSSCRDLLRDG